MVNAILTAGCGVLNFLDIGLAWVDFGIHYVSGYLLYYLVGGMKPQWHTRPSKRKDGQPYSPAFLVTGASQDLHIRYSPLRWLTVYT